MEVSDCTVPHPKDLKRNIQLASTRLPSILDEDTRKSQPLLEGTTKTTPRPEEPLGDKDSGGNKPPADMKLINPTVADPSGTSAKYQGVFEAGEDMDEDTQEDTEVQSLPQNAKKPESSHVQDTNESTLTLVLISKKVVVSYADLKASIEGYYEENIDHKEQTDKVIDAAMNSLDKNGIARGDLLNALNGVTKALKAIQDTVKEDHADTEEPLSHTEGEHAAVEEEPTNALPITTVKPTEISTLKVQPITTIISTSQPGPSIPQREGKAIVTNDQPEDQRNLLTDEQIQAHLDKEKKIKKASKEAKMFEMTKTEVIKVVQEEAEKIGLDPKKIISAKACEKFKKAQDAEHQVLKREHSQKTKRAIELRMKRVEHYMWTMSNGLKPEPITDVKIHPNTKPAVLTVYRNNDKSNFEVHNPFKFGDFGITELDELGPIIEKKNKSIIKDLKTSLGKRYERLKKIPEELGIHSALPAPVPGQVASQSSGRKRKHMELEPGIKVPGLECNRTFQRWNDIHKVGVDSLVSYLVMALMIKMQKNARFGLKLRKLIAEHPDQERLQSKKVKLEALGYKLD
ncbi:hypothetical protein Tco_0928549 [Tanacetum coccineum]